MQITAAGAGAGGNSSRRACACAAACAAPSRTARRQLANGAHRPPQYHDFHASPPPAPPACAPAAAAACAGHRRLRRRFIGCRRTAARGGRVGRAWAAGIGGAVEPHRRGRHQCGGAGAGQPHRRADAALRRDQPPPDLPHDQCAGAADRGFGLGQRAGQSRRRGEPGAQLPARHDRAGQRGADQPRHGGRAGGRAGVARLHRGRGGLRWLWGVQGHAASLPVVGADGGGRDRLADGRKNMARAE